GRVHPPLPPPHPARWLPPHPLLRLHGERPSHGQTRPVPCTPGRRERTIDAATTQSLARSRLQGPCRSGALVRSAVAACPASATFPPTQNRIPTPYHRSGATHYDTSHADTSPRRNLGMRAVCRPPSTRSASLGLRANQ